MEVRDLLLRPPDDRPYDTLKSQLIKRTAASEQRKLQQLISGEELGDRKPTQLLRRMQQLLGDKLGPAEGNTFLHELFIQRLPANVRMVLASTDPSMDLRNLAELADKVVEVATQTVSAVSNPHPPPPVNTEPSDIKHLREEVARLTQLVESLTTRSRRRSPSLPRSRCSGSLAPSSMPQDSLCWYHRTFGDDAQKCKEPCTWGVKHPGRTLAATSATGTLPCRLFYVQDRTTGTQFLVDTGSEVCVVPPSSSDPRVPIRRAFADKFNIILFVQHV